MAGSRVYRYDARRPGCGSNWMLKVGCPRGRQRYCGGDCQRHWAPQRAYRRPGTEVKERSLRMYTGGSSLSAIGRVLGYSATAALEWVKKGVHRPEPAAGAQCRPHGGAGGP